MAGKFEIYEDRAGGFRFRLKAANGQVLASGGAYESKAAARKGCESVQKAVDGARVTEATAQPTARRGRTNARAELGGSAVPEPRHEPSDDRPVRRRFRAAGTLSAAPDLSRQVDEILAGDAGRPA